MNYVSIDIETTGLDPETCQILEIGAVWDDMVTPIEELPTYNVLIQHGEYRGSAYALFLNHTLLGKLCGRVKHEKPQLTPELIANDFYGWLEFCGWDHKKSLTAAGKNFASFDRRFLERLPNFKSKIKIHHRSIDPAILFWRPGDVGLPSSQTCYDRAGLKIQVAHTAVQDALAIVQLIRVGLKL